MQRQIKIHGLGSAGEGVGKLDELIVFVDGALQRRRLEVFIDEFSGDIYGEEIFVAFVSKIRDEKIFSSADELKAQLADDLRFMRDVTAD